MAPPSGGPAIFPRPGDQSLPHGPGGGSVGGGRPRHAVPSTDPPAGQLHGEGRLPHDQGNPKGWAIH